MKRPASVLVLVLFALIALLVVPAAAQDDPTIAPDASAAAVESVAPVPTEEPSAEPLPTAIPVGDGPLVQAVKFFSPTCPHCHLVINETLPPLFAEHGGPPVVTWDPSLPVEEVAYYLMSNGRLQILLVDVSVAGGQAMFGADSGRLGLEQAGVPRLDVEDSYLVGSTDIPEQLPGIVAEGFAGEGIEWPEVPGLAEALAVFVEQGAVPDPSASPEPEGSQGPATVTAEPSAVATAPAHDPFAVIPVAVEQDESPLDKVAKDPVGNGISIVVLLLLGISIIAAPLLAVRGALPSSPSWIPIVLVLAGMAVAAYLASVETGGAEAVCGPVGDCSAVQESEYSRLLGFHIGVLGLIGYGLIGVLWIISRVARGALADWALVLMAMGTLFGVAFSAYLTFLEPFVIGATCMWCITSALLMLALLWVSVGPGYAAWRRIRAASDDDAGSATS